MAENDGIVIWTGSLKIRLMNKYIKSKTKSNSKDINAIMKEMGIIDVWQELHPTNKEKTLFLGVRRPKVVVKIVVVNYGP